MAVIAKVRNKVNGCRSWNFHRSRHSYFKQGRVFLKRDIKNEKSRSIEGWRIERDFSFFISERENGKRDGCKRDDF